jgi:type IX secretion system PorP/SprF family membrane protein
MKILIRLLFLIGTLPMNAQFIPNSGQAFQFMPMFNPAFTGIERFNDLKIGYRYQWSGFGSYSPKFLNLSYATRLIEPLDLTFNSLRLSEPSAVNSENLPRSKRMIHGIGGNVFHSKIGVLESIGANVNYAVHYPMGNSARFAFGATFLLENRKLDVGEVSVRDPDEYYNYLLNGSTSQTDLNIRAGVLVYGDWFYVGLSYFPIVYKPLEQSDLEMTQAFYRGSVQAGVSIPISAEVLLKPGVLALVQMNDKILIDYHIKAYFRENIWFGVSYRDIKSGVAIIGWNFNERLTASYSYEMSLGEFKQFNDGSHDLVLSLRLNNFRKYPQYTW